MFLNRLAYKTHNRTNLEAIKMEYTTLSPCGTLISKILNIENSNLTPPQLLQRTSELTLTMVTTLSYNKIKILLTALIHTLFTWDPHKINLLILSLDLLFVITVKPV